jgi:hypothetical protein
LHRGGEEPARPLDPEQRLDSKPCVRELRGELVGVWKNHSGRSTGIGLPVKASSTDEP